MFLIKCPECKKKISDQAAQCPNCGFKITSEIKAELLIKQQKKLEKKSTKKGKEEFLNSLGSDSSNEKKLKKQNVLV